MSATNASLPGRVGSGADPAVVIQWINYAQVTDSVVVAQGHLVVQLSGGGR
jgi:hypothetical protein